MIFFQALFVIVAEELSKLPKGQSIQSAWYHHLSAGETSVKVGIPRTNLYDQVVALAKLVENTTFFHATNPLIFNSRFTTMHLVLHRQSAHSL